MDGIVRGRGVLAFSRLIVLVVLVLGVGAGALEARQTPADTAAVVLDVAGTLESEGRGEAARALLELIVRRYPGTPAAAEAALRLAAMRRIEDGGSTELRVWGTLYGAWLGIAVPAMFDSDDPVAYGAGLLLGTPLGFFATRQYTRTRSVSEGAARAITFGGSWGTWQGYGWREVFELGTRKERVCFDGSCLETEQVPTEAVFVSLVLGGLAGIGAGLAIAATQEISAGGATATSLGALWGTWYGVAAGLLADLEDDALLTSALIGGNTGLIGTALLVRGTGIPRSRARLVSVAGVAGAAVGVGIDLLFRIDDRTPAVLIPTVTSALGLALGAYRTRDRDGGSDEREDAPGALLELRDGTLAWGTPLPTLTLAPDRHGRPKAGVGLELVRARF